MQMAAGERPGPLRELYWVGSLLKVAFFSGGPGSGKEDQDGWCQSILMVHVANRRNPFDYDRHGDIRVDV